MKLYSGIVEDNNDPDKVGKVKIRIVSLHGDGKNGKYVGTGALDWFEPCIPFYGGYESGSFIIPPVGAVVWCIVDEVESGIPYKVYLGGCYGTGPTAPKKFGSKTVPKGKLETPSQALSGYPNAAVLFKSMSGSSIYFTADGGIVITAGGATISLSDGGISIKGGTININGSTVNIN